MRSSRLKTFLLLPIGERRKVMRKQAETWAPYYSGLNAGTKWEMRRRNKPTTPRPKCPYRLTERKRMWKQGFNYGTEYIGWL